MKARTSDTAPTLGSLQRVAVIVAMMQELSAIHYEILFPEYHSKLTTREVRDRLESLLKRSRDNLVILPKN